MLFPGPTSIQNDTQVIGTILVRKFLSPHFEYSLAIPFVVPGRYYDLHFAGIDHYAGSVTHLQF